MIKFDPKANKVIVIEIKFWVLSNHYLICLNGSNFNYVKVDSNTPNATRG
ncbi:hypothetical protein CR513_56679, partial [Mucuna pruriens]